MINSFEAIIDNNSKILILGSLPGIKSLEKKEYYGNFRNDFWKIIFSHFNEPLTSDYELKKKFLLENKIALWDIIKNANREGSLDSAIKNESPNNIELLLKNYPNIELIIFNGQKAETLFKKYFRSLNINSMRVPSTSPMNGKYVKKFEEKKILWDEALNILN